MNKTALKRYHLPKEKALFFLDEDDIYEGNSPHYFDPHYVEGVNILMENWDML